jgi:hypothetical protein
MTAADEPPPLPVKGLDPTQVSWRLPLPDSRSEISLQPGAENLLSGAVELRYEQVLLMCDTARWFFSRYPGTEINVLERCHVLSGPTGPKPNEVLFDSLASSLPKLGFRGRLTPQRIDAQRQAVPADETTTPGALGLVAHRAVFTGLGDFSGDLRTKSRDGQGEWKGVSGWATTVELLLLSDVTPKGVVNTRLRRLDFHGHPGDESTPARVAEVHRYDHPIGGASGAELAKEKPAASTKVQKLGLIFDDAGQVAKVETVGWSDGSAANLFPDTIHRAQPARTDPMPPRARRAE